jgi:hypothetical protein
MPAESSVAVITGGCGGMGIACARRLDGGVTPLFQKMGRPG